MKELRESFLMPSHFEKDESTELDELESALDAAFDKFKNAQKNMGDDTVVDDASIDDLLIHIIPNDIDHLDDLLKDD